MSDPSHSEDEIGSLESFDEFDDEPTAEEALRPSGSGDESLRNLVQSMMADDDGDVSDEVADTTTSLSKGKRKMRKPEPPSEESESEEEELADLKTNKQVCFSFIFLMFSPRVRSFIIIATSGDCYFIIIYLISFIIIYLW